MMTCENCGCKMYNGFCTNCDEEIFIIEQYHELNMPLPDEETYFMQKANESMRRKANKDQSINQNQ